MDINKDFMISWMSHRKALHGLIVTFENEHLDFKPWDDAMSLSELVLHITSAAGMFVQTVKRGIFTPPQASKSFETISELKEFVSTETSQMKSELESLTKEQLENIVEFSGLKISGRLLLETAKDHEIHHKGQLFTYARLIGIEKLPFFVSKS